MCIRGSDLFDVANRTPNFDKVSEGNEETINAKREDEMNLVLPTDLRGMRHWSLRSAGTVCRGRLIRLRNPQDCSAIS